MGNIDNEEPISDDLVLDFSKIRDNTVFKNFRKLCEALGIDYEKYKDGNSKKNIVKQLKLYCNFLQEKHPFHIIEVYEHPLQEEKHTYQKLDLKYTSKCVSILLTWKGVFFYSLNELLYHLGFVNSLYLYTIRNRSKFKKNKRNKAVKKYTCTNTRVKKRVKYITQSHFVKKIKMLKDNYKLFQEIPSFIDFCKSNFHRIVSEMTSQLYKFDFCYKEYTVVQDMNKDKNSEPLDFLNQKLPKGLRMVIDSESKLIEELRLKLLNKYNCNNMHELQRKNQSSQFFNDLNKALSVFNVKYIGKWYLIYSKERVTCAWDEKISDYDRVNTLMDELRDKVYDCKQSLTEKTIKKAINALYVDGENILDNYRTLWHNAFGNKSLEQIKDYIYDLQKTINRLVVKQLKDCCKRETKNRLEQIDKKSQVKESIYDNYKWGRQQEEFDAAKQTALTYEYYKKCLRFINKNIKIEQRIPELNMSENDILNITYIEELAKQYPPDKWDEIQFPQEPSKNNESILSIEDIEEVMNELPNILAQKKMKRDKQIAYIISEAFKEIAQGVSGKNGEEFFYGLKEETTQIVKSFYLTKVATNDIDIILNNSAYPGKTINMLVHSLSEICSHPEQLADIENTFIYETDIKQYNVKESRIVIVNERHNSYGDEIYANLIIYLRWQKKIERYEILRVILNNQRYIDFFTPILEEN